jgi:hypothetical protein
VLKNRTSNSVLAKRGTSLINKPDVSRLEELAVKLLENLNKCFKVTEQVNHLLKLHCLILVLNAMGFRKHSALKDRKY